jgi:hypothetical protein
MEMRLDGPQIAVFIDFENVATSAEANYGDFDVTAVTDLLRSRAATVKARPAVESISSLSPPNARSGIDLLRLPRSASAKGRTGPTSAGVGAMGRVPQPENTARHRLGRPDFTAVHKLPTTLKYDRHRAALGGIGPAAGVGANIFWRADQRGMANIADQLQLPVRALPRGTARRAGRVPVFAGRLKQIMQASIPRSTGNYGYQQFAPSRKVPQHDHLAGSR